MVWLIPWLIATMLVPIFVSYQSMKGIKMTPREFYFFLYGLFILGMPFVYVVTHG